MMKGFITTIGTSVYAKVDITGQKKSVISFQYWKNKHFSVHIETRDDDNKKIWKSCFFDKLDSIKITKDDSTLTCNPVAEIPLGDISTIDDLDTTMEGISNMSDDPNCNSDNFTIPYSELSLISILSGSSEAIEYHVKDYRYIEINVLDFPFQSSRFEIKALRMLDDSGAPTEYIPVKSKLDVIFSKKLNTDEIEIDLGSN